MKSPIEVQQGLFNSPNIYVRVPFSYTDISGETVLHFDRRVGVLYDVLDRFFGLIGGDNFKHSIRIKEDALILKFTFNQKILDEGSWHFELDYLEYLQDLFNIPYSICCSQCTIDTIISFLVEKSKIVFVTGISAKSIRKYLLTGKPMD